MEAILDRLRRSGLVPTLALEANFLALTQREWPKVVMVGLLLFCYCFRFAAAVLVAIAVVIVSAAV